MPEIVIIPGPLPCQCLTCLRERREMLHYLPIENCRMIVCSICGNKRCPHASWHEQPCTGSNAVGQPGSDYSPIPYEDVTKDIKLVKLVQDAVALKLKQWKAVREIEKIIGHDIDNAEDGIEHFAVGADIEEGIPRSSVKALLAAWGYELKGGIPGLEKEGPTTSITQPEVRP